MNFPGKTLTFSDEFNRSTLTSGADAPWNTTFLGGLRNLATNGEKQLYLDDNATTLVSGATVTADPFQLQDGVLSISARPTSTELRETTRMDYTSGLINTAGNFDFRYGYVEIRAELPAGKGLWPAFWLRWADGAKHGEIDIMEVMGHDTDFLYSTLHHANGTDKVVRAKVDDMAKGFHTYGLDWTETSITIYFDGKPLGQVATPDGLKTSMYLLSNLAVGGTWPGLPDASTPWAQADLKIDYVRVWQDASALASKTVTGTTNADFLSGGDGADQIAGGAGHDTLVGGRGDDLIKGEIGNDRLLGGLGHDTLDGGAGADTMLGGAGDDTYLVDDAGDVVTEMANEGTDTVRTSLASYTLKGNIENLVDTGAGKFAGTGNSFDNAITGGSGNDVLKGGAGNDTLIGGAGHDKLSGGLGNDVLWGGSGNDTLMGADGADTFAFRSGDSGTTFVGDFQVDVDTLDVGGLGLTSFSDVQAHASTSKEGNLIITAGAEKLILRNIKLAQLSAGDFKFDADTSSPPSDNPSTPPGDPSPTPAPDPSVPPDTGSLPETGKLVTGTDAQDSLLGSSGHDQIIGLDGNDRLGGLDGADSLDGGTGADVLVGGAGADQLEGGAGLDTASYVNAGSGVALDMLEANWLGARGDATGDSFASIEAVQGSVYDDVLLLTDQNDLASGGAGQDRIEGRDGADILKGMDGNDILLGGAGNDKLVGGTGADRLEGGAGQDILVGGAGADTFVFAGAGTGKDLITDFAGGPGSGDVIEWHGQFADFAAVQAHAQEVSDVASPFGGSFTGTVITSDAGDQVWLANISKANLHAGDFAFL